MQKLGFRVIKEYAIPESRALLLIDLAYGDSEFAKLIRAALLEKEISA